MAVLHRNSGDVGAAADLAAARAAIADRTPEGEDPFAAVDRGAFDATRRVPARDLGASAPAWLAAVELGAYVGNGLPAVRVELVAGASVATDDGVGLTLESGGNGIVVMWPGRDRDHALLTDLRSGEPYGEPGVETAPGAIVVPLPEVFDPAHAWSVMLVDPASRDVTPAIGWRRSARR